MAWQLVAAQLGFGFGRWLLSKWFGSPSPPPPKPGTLEVPLASEGDPIPLVYGTRRLAGNVVHSGAFSTDPVQDISGATIGYTYRVGFHVVFGLSNATTTYGSGATLRNLYVGDRRVRLDPSGSDPTLWRVEEGSWYGGPGQGGGVIGRVWWRDGDYTQTMPADWIAAMEADFAATPSLIGTIPGYRGMISAAFLGIDTTEGFVVGESGTMEPWSVELYNPVMIPARTEGVAPIGLGDANPASVLYNLLVERGGVPSTLIDVDSFAAAADVLQAEGHGISIVWRGDRVGAHVREVENQIDGTVRVNRITNKLELVLARQDYNPVDLPSFGPSDVISPPRFTATTWDELPNEVRVNFLDASKQHTQRTAIERNTALIDSLLGRRRTVTIEYPGVSSADLASRLCARELLSVGRPTVAMRGLELCRRGHRLRRGDVFRFTWPERDITDMVFRVVRANMGTLERGVVTIDAIQDRYDGAIATWTPPDVVTDSPGAPMPVIDRVATEAPRWIQQQAYNAGAIANVDAQLGYFLAAPEGTDVLYRARLGTSSSAGVDLPPRSFPGTFVLDAAYARSAGPYDTSVGMTIREVDGVTLAAALDAAIAAGANLIMVEAELMAFGGYTSLGGGIYELTDVWRGVLDTVPADHLEGARGYFLPGTSGMSAMGSAALAHGDSITVATEAQSASEWTPASESPTDTLTARSRVRLPYPVDALTVNGSQTPATLTDDGVALTYARRDRLAATIVRPDAADATPEAGTTYNAVAIKDGVTTTLATGITSGSTVYALGAAGHGVLEVGVDSQLAVALPDGTTPTLGAWQVPTIAVTAPQHRNLVINGSFASGTANWTVTSGSASAGSGSWADGMAGTFVTAASGTTSLVLYQDIPVSGYPPENLRAWCEFLAGPTSGDSNDTFAVSLKALDSGGATLSTTTIAATHPTARDRYSLEITDLPDGTATARIQFTIAIAVSGDGGDTTANVGVTEVRVHVGQFTDQLLTNPEFASGTTGWTVSGGGWATQTATLYDAAQYLRPTDGASAQLRQDVTPAAGWERGSAAVLRCGRMNDAADDTGTVTMQALDVGGSVLASSTTGAEAITPVNTWARRYLALELPDATATVRVQLDAARVTGTPLNACFGSFELRIHKDLDAEVDEDRTFQAPPTQRIPASRAEWVAAWPTVTAPNVAIYAGQATGALGSEPLLEVVGSAAMGGEFVVDEGRPDDRRRTSCYDLTGGTVKVAPVGNAFLNFRSTEDWAVGVVYKIGESWQGSEVGLIARFDGVDRGWELGLNASGIPTALLHGPGGVAEISGGEDSPDFGALRIAFVHYDASSTTLSVVDADGVANVSAATIGEFRTPEPDVATVGVTGSYGALIGQLGRIWAWRGSTTPTASELAALITYDANPADVSEPHARALGVATIDGSDGTGVMLRTWPVGVAPHALDEELGERGLVASPAVTNLLDQTLATWALVGGTRATAQDRATGVRAAAAITGTSTQGIRSPAIALGSAGTRYFAVVYQAPDAAASFVLEDNSGSTVATQTLPLSATWRVIEFAMTWSGATSGNAKIRIAPSTTGTSRTITVSPVMLASSAAVKPARGVIPLGASGAVCPSVGVSVGARFNAEGELLVDAALTEATTGTIARAWNATNGNDARALRLDASDIKGNHATGAASNTAVTVTPTIDTAVRYTTRLRWAQVGLADGTASEFTSVRAEQGAVVDTASGRTATWTPSSTAITRVDVGHDDGADVAAGAYARVRLRCREPRL